MALAGSNKPLLRQAAQENAFGSRVAIDNDTLIVAATNEDSDGRNSSGSDDNNERENSGAAYVFVRNGTTWTQQAMLKASNADEKDRFGHGIAIDGDRVVVSSQNEASATADDSADNTASEAGAVYVFNRSGTTWLQEAYLKAPATQADELFGSSVALRGDDLLVGSSWEDGNGTGLNSNENDNSMMRSGAAHTFEKIGANWVRTNYIKASNTGGGDGFGSTLGLAEGIFAIGATSERSAESGVGQSGTDNSANLAGAVYVWSKP